MTPCTITVDSGSTVDITYDYEREAIRYVANVRFGQYLSLGYGSSMKYTDYVVWQSYENFEETSQIDCFSVNNHHPPENPINSYNTTIT